MNKWGCRISGEQMRKCRVISAFILIGMCTLFVIIGLKEYINYEIYSVTYMDGVGTIKDLVYPQVRGLKDKSVEEKINQLLYDTVTSTGEFMSDEFQQHITYEVKRADKNILCIAYRDDIIHQPSMYPYLGYYAVVIDMHTGTKLELENFMSMEALEEHLLSGDFVETTGVGWFEEVTVEYILEALAKYSEYPGADFYITEDSIGVIMHFMRLYLTFEVPYEY